MFEALENTAAAIWVGESLWGYPILLGMHVVGLAIVAGIFLMLDLRILGFNKGVSYESFLSLFRIAWIGLAINGLSCPNWRHQAGSLPMNNSCPGFS